MIHTKLLNDYINAKRRSLCLPGLSIGIVQDNEIVSLRGFGRADQTGHPVTPQTPFIIGSLSKSITALAIMQLFERDQLELDAPVQHALPWFRVADAQASVQITVRHLLTHTSGISRYAGRELLSGDGIGTMEQRVRELVTLKLTSPVGTTYQYSNTNYLILGLIVQTVSGQSYTSYVQHHIFAPLEMHHSYTSEQEARQHGLATGYRWWFGWPLPARMPYLADALPAAYLISCAEDIAHYLLALLNDGCYGGVSVISPESLAEVWRPEVTITPSRRYAKGWQIASLDGVPIITHGGEVANYRAEIIIVPERKLGVVVLANCNNGLVAQLGLDRIAPDVVRLLLDKPLPLHRVTLRRFYILVDLVIIVLSVLSFRSLLQAVRRAGQLPGLVAVSQLVAPFILFRHLPKWTGTPWRMLRMYVPDVALWIAGIVSCLMIDGIKRIAYHIFRLRW